MSSLFPDLSSMIQYNRPEQEVMTIDQVCILAEYFEHTLELGKRWKKNTQENQKNKANKLTALQFQGTKPSNKPSYHFKLQGAPPKQSWPPGPCHISEQTRYWKKKTVPKENKKTNAKPIF